MRAKSKHAPATSFSKKLLIFFIAVACVLTVVAIVLALRPVESYEGLNALITLTSVWTGGTTVFSGFYAWKAKNENRHKYAQKWLRDIGELYGWEAAARFAEIVLKGD